MASGRPAVGEEPAMGRSGGRHTGKARGSPSASWLSSPSNRMGTMWREQRGLVGPGEDSGGNARPAPAGRLRGCNTVPLTEPGSSQGGSHGTWCVQ